MRTLSHQEAKEFYDRFGAKQDAQGWYEDPATRALEVMGALHEARSVVEFGCGTGKLAARLLTEVLPSDARYVALDQSTTMVRLAKERLAAWNGRATVEAVSGPPDLRVGVGAADRVLSTYVLDLLSEEDIRRFLDEAHRVLAPGGRLCITNLTYGETGLAKLVTSLWLRIHRSNPARVGGCRPLRMTELLDARWTDVRREVVTAWGLSSESVAAVRK